MQKLMFNDQYGLTQAIVDGIKTETRRIASNQNYVNPLCSFRKERLNVKEMLRDGEVSKYTKGEVVAIAQSYKDIVNESLKIGFPLQRLVEDHYNEPGWNCKMFVKADLMPPENRCTDSERTMTDTLPLEKPMPPSLTRYPEKEPGKGTLGCLFTILNL